MKSKDKIMRLIMQILAEVFLIMGAVIIISYLSPKGIKWWVGLIFIGGYALFKMIIEEDYRFR